MISKVNFLSVGLVILSSSFLAIFRCLSNELMSVVSAFFLIAVMLYYGIKIMDGSTCENKNFWKLTLFSIIHTVAVLIGFAVGGLLWISLFRQ